MVPAPAKYVLTFISATSVQDDPFHCSTSSACDGGGLCCPPAYRAAVDIPKPAPPYLAVFKSLTSVQLDPFHNSVTAIDVADTGENGAT